MIKTKRDPIRIVEGIPCFCSSVEEDHTDYKAAGLDHLHKFENTYFWFIARREYILGSFIKFIEKESDIIEIGAGTGSVARTLIDNNFKVAVGELHIKGLLYAKTYGINDCYQIDIFDQPFSQAFSAVGMFDVLEHLENDKLALENIYDMLTPGGKLVLTVPAHAWLWSNEDVVAGHKRRYSKSSLSHLLETSGFRVIEANYIFIFILPLLWLRKLIRPANEQHNHQQGENWELSIHPLLNTILLGLCRIEKKIRKLLPNFVGGSILLVAEKAK